MTVVEFERQVQKKVFLRTFTYLTHNLDDLMAFADRVLKPFLDAPLPVPPPKQLGVLTRKMATLKIEEGKAWEASKDTRDSGEGSCSCPTNSRSCSCPECPPGGRVVQFLEMEMLFSSQDLQLS